MKQGNLNRLEKLENKTSGNKVGFFFNDGEFPVKIDGHWDVKRMVHSEEELEDLANTPGITLVEYFIV